MLDFKLPVITDYCDYYKITCEFMSIHILHITSALLQTVNQLVAQEKGDLKMKNNINEFYTIVLFCKNIRMCLQTLR